MGQSKEQSTGGFPSFERPSEAVVFGVLENLCAGAGGRIMLSIPQLARPCGLAVSTTNRAVLSLARKGMIGYQAGYNQARPSVFEMPVNGQGVKLPSRRSGGPKIGAPIPNDSDSDSSRISIGDRIDRGAVHKRDASGTVDAERLAYRVADGLGDVKNLRLYQSYCRRYPADLILKAYVRAKEPTPDKIKKSRGALFNFLVQLYARRGNDN